MLVWCKMTVNRSMDVDLGCKFVNWFRPLISIFVMSAWFNFEVKILRFSNLRLKFRSVLCLCFFCITTFFLYYFNFFLCLVFNLIRKGVWWWWSGGWQEVAPPFRQERWSLRVPKNRKILSSIILFFCTIYTCKSKINN